MQDNQTKSIVATNLYDMLLEVQAAVKEGFVLSDKNEHYPQAFIGMYTCGMVLPEQTNTTVEKALDEVIQIGQELNNLLDENSKIVQDVAEKKTTVAKPATTKRNTNDLGSNGIFLKNEFPEILNECSQKVTKGSRK